MIFKKNSRIKLFSFPYSLLIAYQSMWLTNVLNRIFPYLIFISVLSVEFRTSSDEDVKIKFKKNSRWL
jgi:hypothetical protein